MTIKKSIHVKRPVETAFRVFTEDIGKWWPLKEGYSFGGDRADQISLEARPGGRFFERFTDGEEYVVGVGHRVRAPVARRVQLEAARAGTRRPRWRCASRAEGAGTRVDLEHRGWERAGAAAEKAGPGYGGGWEPCSLATLLPEARIDPRGGSR